MKRYQLTFFKSIVAWAVTALFFVSPAAAQGNTVEVKLNQAGDVLLVEASTKAGEPAQRMNPEPAYLELSFPGSSLQGAPFSKSIDKGLVQRVVTAQEDGKVLMRVFVLNKPKTKLTKTANGYVYEVNLREMANAPVRTTQAPAQPAAETPSQPATAATKPPTSAAPPATAATNPSTPAAPPATKPSTPATPPATAATKPAPPVTNAPATKPATAATNAPANKPATVATPPTSATTKPATPVTPPTTQQTPAATSAPTTSAPPVVATAAPVQIVREYFPFQKRSAEKALEAARLAFPGLTYSVDSELNVLLVEGPAAEVAELEKFLRAQSPK